jgi:hypothetical protein
MTNSITPTEHDTSHLTGHPASGPTSRAPLMLGALCAVIFANLVQIAAGLAGVDPGPPADVLPLIAATAALGVAAVPMVRSGDRGGLWLGIACCTVSTIGMGPHKLFLDDGLTIAPMALIGFGFQVAFIRAAALTLRDRS